MLRLKRLKSEQIELSVIVPVFNLEKMVGKCLDSILCQMNESTTEIIIINDGSTDGSSEIINWYAKTYKNIKVIHKENQGISIARNVGLNTAKGNYVLFIDSDDYIAADMLELMLKRARSCNADIVISKVVNISTDGNQEEMFKTDFNENEIINGLEAVRRFLIGEINGHPWNKLIRRELFVNNSIEFPANMIFEDAPTLIKLYLVSDKIAFVNKSLYYYVQHAKSLTKVPKFSVLDDHLKMLDIIIKAVGEKYCFDVFSKEFQYFLLKQMYYHLDLCNQLYYKDINKAKKHIRVTNNYIKLISLKNLINNIYLTDLKDKIRLLLLKTKTIYILKLRYKY